MMDDYLMGILLGFIVGMLVLVVVLILTKKDGSLKCKFDERQEVIRGRAFRYGFYTLLIYDGVFAFLEEVVEPFMEYGVVLLIGIILAMLVCVIYCIWNEGYFSLNENPKRIIIVFVAITIMNLLLGIRHIFQGDLVVNGKISFLNSANLICSLAIIIILIVLIVKQICKKREVEK